MYVKRERERERGNIQSWDEKKSLYFSSPMSLCVCDSVAALLDDSAQCDFIF